MPIRCWRATSQLSPLVHPGHVTRKAVDIGKQRGLVDAAHGEAVLDPETRTSRQGPGLHTVGLEIDCRIGVNGEQRALSRDPWADVRRSVDPNNLSTERISAALRENSRTVDPRTVIRPASTGCEVGSDQRAVRPVQ